jgi:LysM repeat protein
MKITTVIQRLCLLLLAAGLAGCLPSGDNALDEQKDPYFLAGNRKLSSFDFKGAAESFERAVETNPRNASAHFQLGVLYEQRISEENSYAVAIYHYDKFLQLRPKSQFADIVKQRIIACKQELAKPIALGPGTQSVLRDMERLKVENTQLKSQLEAWVAYATNRAANLAPPVFTNPAPASSGVNPPPGPGPTVVTSNIVAPPPRAPRTHKVQSNETPEKIARQYGVSTKALMDANPKVDARRLKIGQVLNVPAQ